MHISKDLPDSTYILSESLQEKQCYEDACILSEISYRCYRRLLSQDLCSRQAYLNSLFLHTENLMLAKNYASVELFLNSLRKIINDSPTERQHYFSLLMQYTLKIHDFSRAYTTLSTYKEMITDAPVLSKCEYYFYLTKYHYLLNHAVSAATSYQWCLKYFPTTILSNHAVAAIRVHELYLLLLMNHRYQEAYALSDASLNDIKQFFGSSNPRYVSCLYDLLNVGLYTEIIHLSKFFDLWNALPSSQIPTEKNLIIKLRYALRSHDDALAYKTLTSSSHPVKSSTYLYYAALASRQLKRTQEEAYYFHACAKSISEPSCAADLSHLLEYCKYIANKEKASYVASYLYQLMASCDNYVKNTLPSCIYEYTHLEDVALIKRCQNFFLQYSLLHGLDVSIMYGVVLSLRNLILSISVITKKSDSIDAPTQNYTNTRDFTNLSMQCINALSNHAIMYEFIHLSSEETLQCMEGYLVFVITNQGITLRFVNDHSGLIAQSIYLLNQQLTNCGENAIRRTQFKKYQSYLSAQFSFLNKDHSSMVYLVPDQALCVLSFSLLFPNTEFHYLNSGKDLIKITPLGASPVTTILADADYSECPKEHSNDYVYSPYEDICPVTCSYENLSYRSTSLIQKWNQFLPQTIRYTKASMNDELIKQTSFPGTTIFFTHGECLFFTKEKEAITFPHNPLYDIYLVLTGVNSFLDQKKGYRPFEDGILSAQDFLAMNFKDSSLVILAACFSGQGNYLSGESLAGMRLSLFAVGVPCLLVTLWAVNETATIMFLHIFLYFFASGYSVNSALLATKRTFRKHKRYKNPYYWAGFLCIGNDEIRLIVK